MKAATLGGLDVKDVEGVIADEASKLADEYVGNRLTRQKEEKKAIQAFREALDELPRQLQKGNTGAKHLVFIIDELDRCRPLFALELLEKIKHFFSVSSIHFVLGVNLAQLRSSVEMIYGAKTDAHMYLEKFINLTLPLDTYDEERGFPSAMKFLHYFTSRLEIKKTDDGKAVGMAIECISRFATTKGISLRSIEKVMSNFVVTLQSSGRTTLVAPAIVAGLCMMKVTDPQGYLLAKKGKLNFIEARRSLVLPEFPKRHERTEVNWWRYCTDLDSKEEFDIRSEANAISSDRFAIVPTLANNLIDAFAVGLAS